MDQVVYETQVPEALFDTLYQSDGWTNLSQEQVEKEVADGLYFRLSPLGL